MKMKEGSFEYESTAAGAVITKYLGGTEETEDEESQLTLQIPETLGGQAVTAIGPGSFSDNGTTLIEIRVPDSVTEIGKEAFAYCYLLESLSLGRNVRHLGSGFLSFCGSMEQLTIPASVQEIDEPYLLNDLRLECAPGGRFRSDGFGLYQTDPYGSPGTLISVCTKDSRTSYTIFPGTTAIGAHAFDGQSHLRNIILPDSLREIGDHAFRNCPDLTEFDLPASVCQIGEAALENSGWDDNVDSLIPIRAHGGALSVLDDALLLCSPDGSQRDLVRYFGHARNYRIPEGVTGIRTGAFHRTRLEIIFFPSSVRNVEPGAFTGNSHLQRFDFGTREQTASVLFPDVVFRKDDIEALFLPQASEYICLGSPLQFTPDPDTLFQFRAYDCLFTTYAGDINRAVIAVSRLAWPVDLSPDRKAFYLQWLAGNLQSLLAEMTKKDDPTFLRQVLSLDILTRSQIEISVEYCSGHHRPVCLQVLLEYSHRLPPEEDFDYSL